MGLVADYVKNRKIYFIIKLFGSAGKMTWQADSRARFTAADG
jgi:hypothetical protein